MPAKVGFLTERMILGFGVDLVVHETACRLPAHGFALVVFTTRLDDTYRQVDYPIVDLSRQVSARDVFSHAFMEEALAILASSQVDAWLVETPPFFHWFEHLPGAVVCVEHGTPPGSFFPRRLGRRIDALTRSRCERVYRHLRPGDGLVAISEFIRNSLPGDVRERAVVVYNGGDHYPLASEAQAAAFRESLGVGDEEAMVLWVGRAELANDVQPYKGFRELLSLAEPLAAARPQARLVMVGRADDAARRAMAQAGIAVATDLPRATMPAALRAADLLISTSRWEGFNLPLVEAQYQGTPVVAYRLGAHPEVVADGVSGVLVASREELVEALLALLADPARRRQLGRGAVAVAARFTWDASVAALAAYLGRCMDEARTRPPAAPPKPPRKDLRYFIEVALAILRQEGVAALIREGASAVRKRVARLVSSNE